jgi:hypothetical protein
MLMSKPSNVFVEHRRSDNCYRIGAQREDHQHRAKPVREICVRVFQTRRKNAALQRSSRTKSLFFL